MSAYAGVAYVKYTYVDGTEEHGYIIADDYSQHYRAMSMSTEVPTDDMELLKFIWDRETRYCSGEIDLSPANILEFVRDNELGMHVNENWYDYDDVKGILNGCNTEDEEVDE